MKDGKDGGKSVGVGPLIREIADGLGQLMAQHLRLAQLDLTASMRATASRAAVLAVCAVLMVVGYGLTMVGIALVLGNTREAGLALLVVGLVHVFGAGIGVAISLSRMRRMSVMGATTAVLGESAKALLSPQASASLSATSVAPAAIGGSSARRTLENARGV